MRLGYSMVDANNDHVELRKVIRKTVRYQEKGGLESPIACGLDEVGTALDSVSREQMTECVYITFKEFRPQSMNSFFIEQ